MADAWGGSWGVSWGSSWGTSVAPPVSNDRGGDGVTQRDRSARRARYIRNRHHVIKSPEPVVAKAGEIVRKVTKAVVREALAELPEWFGTLTEARQAVPAAIPMPVIPDRRAEYDRLRMVAAVRQYLEEAARAYEAYEREEDDIELLLMAA